MGKLRLFQVHCGYYDPLICSGIYEAHANFFVVARDAAEAKLKTKQLSEVQRNRMHIDGIVELEAIEGYRMRLEEDVALQGRTLLHAQQFRELAPKAAGAL